MEVHLKEMHRRHKQVMDRKVVETRWWQVLMAVLVLQTTTSWPHSSLVCRIQTKTLIASISQASAKLQQEMFTSRMQLGKRWRQPKIMGLDSPNWTLSIKRCSREAHNILFKSKDNLLETLWISTVFSKIITRGYRKCKFNKQSNSNSESEDWTWTNVKA